MPVSDSAAGIAGSHRANSMDGVANGAALCTLSPRSGWVTAGASGEILMSFVLKDWKRLDMVTIGEFFA